MTRKAHFVWSWFTLDWGNSSWIVADIRLSRAKYNYQESAEWVVPRATKIRTPRVPFARGNLKEQTMSAKRNSLYKHALSMAVFGIVLISSILTGSALGQDFKRPDGSVPLPMDWSDRHVIYTVGMTGEQVEKAQDDPRYF